MPYLDSGRLAETMRDVLRRLGVCEASRNCVVEALVETSLRGVDSHGVNLFPYYCAAVEAGRIALSPSIEVIEEDESTALIDAGHAFGHHASRVAMDKAMELARKHGVGAVAVRNSNHFGAAGHYALRASRQGFMAFSFTNADALVRAFGSPSTYFGTNPICFTVPMAGEEPLCLDMATSLISWNKILILRRANQATPEGAACDSNGQLTRDPHAVRMLTPIGGYKGFGLGLMVDVLSGLLAGGPVATELLPMYQALDEHRFVSHFFMALDIGRFVDPTAFAQRVRAMAEAIRALPRLDPDVPVMVPGDPEKRHYAQRSDLGIPMDDEKYDEFVALSDRFAEARVE